jgi:hypothetical protein
MLSYSSLTNSGKVTLPSVDSWGTNMNIMRDPPKSIMTRRRDKVGENNDILQMVDNSDRSNEAIMRFSRGVNPSVSVSYSNNGGSLQNFGNQQARLPYSINKDGDFRPPVQAPQDLLPLSRMPRNITSAISNPTMPHFGKELPNSRNVNSTSSVKEQIISSQVKPTKRYYMQKPFQEGFEVNYSIQDVLKKSANSNVSTSDRTQTNVLAPTKEINNDLINAFANSNVSNPLYVNNNINDFNSTKFIQDTNAHSVYTNLNDVNKNVFNEQDLSNIKQKDFLLVEYSTAKSENRQKGDLIKENFELDRTLPVYLSQTNNMGMNNRVSYIHDDIELDRNLPEYQSYTNINSKKQRLLYHDEIELDRNLPEYQSHTNFNSTKKQTPMYHDELELDRNLPEYQSHTNFNSMKNQTPLYHNEIELERNLPEYQSHSNSSSSMKQTPLYHEELELERVLPVYNSSSNIKGTGEVINYIHKDIELNRTLPEHQSSTNIKQNTQKTLKHDYMKELERKSYLTNMATNNNKKGENNVSSRKYVLEDKLQYGEYNSPANIPVFERTQQMMTNFESEKSKMGKRVSEQFHGKYK